MKSRKEFTELVGKRIKELREKKGMSQEELADEAKLYRTYIGHLENARYSASSYVLYKIAVALKVNPGELFIKI